MDTATYSLIDSQVVYEDNHIIVINKLSSQIVQGDKTGDACLVEILKDYLKEKYNKPGRVYCGLVHRLDRPVSGLVIFAKTDKALSRLTKQIKDREIKKIYWAIVKGMPEQHEGTLVNYLKRNEKQNKSYIVSEGTANAKLAVLDYKLIGHSAGGYSLLEVELHTGRHHQIRAQLAGMGCPIKGDLKYGYQRSNPDGSISLHARRLQFVHPVKKEPVELVADVPNTDNLWKAFDV
ncbi:MAG: RluA family pseudouridine synthase [Bacteroidales bacterium]|nr:RluA family pseudouridine synthase [Bacteroidales bacterium]